MASLDAVIPVEVRDTVVSYDLDSFKSLYVLTNTCSVRILGVFIGLHSIGADRSLS
jgi:hypothetical protein